MHLQTALTEVARGTDRDREGNRESGNHSHGDPGTGRCPACRQLQDEAGNEQGLLSLMLRHAGNVTALLPTAVTTFKPPGLKNPMSQGKPICLEVSLCF